MVAVIRPLNKAIIPHQVRFNPLLNASVKMFYGELVALCGSKGYCWARDEHFASLLGKSTKSISRWIKELVKLGYISIVKNPNHHNRREIHLMSLDGTNGVQEADKVVQTSGQTRPQKTGSLYIYKNDILNDNYNDESEWEENARSQVNNNSFSFFNGATPTVEQVRACMKQLSDELIAGIDLVDEARKFYVNYTATGWMMGSAKMKSLPAAVEKWIINTHNFNRKQIQPNDFYRHNNPRKQPFEHLQIKRHSGTKF